MAIDNSIVIMGNLTADPELRYTASGAAVSNFSIAQTPRFQKEGEWQDGETVFLRVNVWRNLAENVCESVRQGDRIIVTGRLTMRQFEDKEGNTRVVYEIDADDIGISFKWVTVSGIFRNEKKEAEKPAAKPAKQTRSSSRR